MTVLTGLLVVWVINQYPRTDTGRGGAHTVIFDSSLWSFALAKSRCPKLLFLLEVVGTNERLGAEVCAPKAGALPSTEVTKFSTGNEQPGASHRFA